MDMKYVIIDDIYPIVFHAGIKHKQFQDIVPSAGKSGITGAGFVNVDVRAGFPIATSFGESTSIKIGRGESDQLVLDMFFREICNNI